MKPFGTPLAVLRVKVNWETIGMSRVCRSRREERAQLSEGRRCTGDACQGIWWEVILWETVCCQVILWESVSWESVVIETKFLVRVTMVILIAREI